MKNCIAGLLFVMWSAVIYSPTLPIQAAPICVTTWDLQPNAAAGPNGWSSEMQQILLQETAESLKKLRPDVILLQQVASIETCQQLAEALQPEIYYVTICSSFRDPHTKLLSRQAAILSKVRAYLVWSEQWQSSGQSPAAAGGFAFAAMRLGDKNVGVFSVQLNEGALSGAADNGVAASQQAADDAARQLAQELTSLQTWKTNWLQAFIVAGDFNTGPEILPLVHENTLLRLEQMGFGSAFAGLPLQKQLTLPGNVWRPVATLDYIFTRNAKLAAPPATIQSGLSEQDVVTCEMDLTAPTISPLPRVGLPIMRAKSTSPARHDRTLWWLAGCVSGCAVVFLIALKSLRRSQFQPGLKAQACALIAPTSERAPYVHIEIGGSAQTQSQTWHPHPDAGPVTGRMPEAMRARVIANLSRWLKQKMLRRLVSDRAQLLATQRAAALKMMAVDKRLAKVEYYIRQRNQEYEQRIDDLLKALVTAKEENRELIRAQIALIKVEMDKTRLRADSESREHHQH